MKILTSKQLLDLRTVGSFEDHGQTYERQPTPRLPSTFCRMATRDRTSTMTVGISSGIIYTYTYEGTQDMSTSLRDELASLADLSDAQAKESARAAYPELLVRLRSVAHDGQRHHYIFAGTYGNPAVRAQLAALCEKDGLSVKKLDGDEYLICWGDETPATTDDNHHDCNICRP